MEPKSVGLKGVLRIGEGKETELMCATPIRPYGDTQWLDLHISSDGRYIWLTLDTASARALAEKILKVLDN